MKGRRTWTAVVALLGIALAGCGGGGGGGDGAFLPLLEDDEQVNRMRAPDASSNNVVACSDGSRIYVAWVERSNLAADRVWFNRSLDGGETWFPDPVPLSHPALSSSSAAIACDGDLVYVVFRIFRDGGSEIRLNRSIDAGTTFLESDVAVSKALGQSASEPALCCAGATVHVTWQDDREGEFDVFYHRSTDAGESFPGSERRLDSGLAGSADSVLPAMVCDGPTLYVAWVDLRSGDSAVRLNRSLDAGATFLASDVAVSHAVTPTIDIPQPSLACEGDTVVVAWSDHRHAVGVGDVFCNRSVDAGASFLTTDRRVDTGPAGASASYAPRLALEGDVVHVAWTEFSGAPVRYNRSEDEGLTFLPEDEPLAPPLPDADPNGLFVVAEGSALVVAWNMQVEEAPSRDDVFLAVSTDGGESFRLARANTDPPEAGLSFQPFVALDGDRLAVVFGDNRGGAPQIRVNRTR